MTRRYSALSLFKEGLAGQTGWKQAWRSPEPKPSYDAIVIGGGGHGLATAYYLAKNHGIARVAVLEKGWIGGGNTGRNTTVVRSNYYYPESVELYGLAHRLYEGLSKDLNYNVMLSQRGMVNLCHSTTEMEIGARTVNAMQINGIDAELFSPEDVRRVAPIYNFSADARFPVFGGIWQGRAGTARHDAVAWGYARAASRLGVDIIQNCEITDFIVEGGRCRASIRRAARSARSASAWRWQGIPRCWRQRPISACRSIPTRCRPAFPNRSSRSSTRWYCRPAPASMSASRTRARSSLAAASTASSYAQRGNLPTLETVIAGVLEMFPIFGQLKLMRQWAGIVDVVPDSSPIIGPSPLPNLFLNCGWGTGGFKAIPAGGTLLANLLATGEHNDISRPFDLDRFASGRLIDEAAGSGIAH
ncbi:FAD-dependent oxidoreductase [Mesorhizobium sp. ORM6]